MATRPPLPPAPAARAVSTHVPAAPGVPAVYALVPAVPAVSTPVAAPPAPVPAVDPPALVPAVALPTLPVEPLTIALAAPAVVPADPVLAVLYCAPSIRTAVLLTPILPHHATERESSRLRRDSPLRHHQQVYWPAHHGGRGGWRGSRGRGGGGAYDSPVRMADLQRVVSNAMREERSAQSHSSSLQSAPAYSAPRQAVLPVNQPPAAALPPPVPAPSAPAPATSPPVRGSRFRLPPVLPVAGVEFVATGGGAVRAPYPPLVAAGPGSHAAEEFLPFLAEALQPP
ncbi:unnamed protein product [Closterium sp. NIES-53]